MSPWTFAYLSHIAAWVLLQLTWQGCLVIFSWLLCDRLLRLSAAGLRYRLTSLHFVAVGALPFLTLGASQWAIVASEQGVGAPSVSTSFAGNRFLGLVLASDQLLARAIPLLVLIWLVGFAAMLVRLVSSWLSVRQMKAMRASAELSGLAHQLANRLNVAAPNILSADVPAPFVSGARRPRIVLPCDVEQNLSSDQLSAILAHELIHIRHADYLWNLLQRALLALCWFHPAAWFLYFRLRQEREIRCDAVAAAECSCASHLAHGLLRLMETVASRRSAVILSSTEGQLETRIRALLQSNVSSNGRGRLIVPVSALLLSSVLALWVGEHCLTDDHLRGLYLASGFGPVISVHAHDDAGTFDLQMQNGRVVKLAVAEQVVPQRRIVQTGEAVTAVSEAGRPLLSLQLDPSGGIHWTPRSK